MVVNPPFDFSRSATASPRSPLTRLWSAPQAVPACRKLNQGLRSQIVNLSVTVTIASCCLLVVTASAASCALVPQHHSRGSCSLMCLALSQYHPRRSCQSPCLVLASHRSCALLCLSITPLMCLALSQHHTAHVPCIALSQHHATHMLLLPCSGRGSRAPHRRK